MDCICDKFVMIEDGEVFEMSQAAKGDPGPGVAPGGTTGQILAKASDEDYDTEWIDQPEMDAEHVSYDSTETYSDGTVGKELSSINSALSSLSAVTEIIDTASGAIASFPDGSGLPMRSLLAQIEPQQDLHGYDAPWAGGSGKNLFDQDTCTTGKYIGETGNIADWTNAEYSDYIAVTAGQQYIFSGTNKTGAQGSTRIHGYNSSKAWVQQITTESVVADAKWNTTFTVPEGISFVRVSTGYPLQDGQLEKGSTASAWTPYANECPITGWTGLSGKRCGANLWDEQWEGGDISAVTGINEGNAQMIRSVGYIPVDASKTYYFFCGSVAENNVRARFYDKNKAYIGYSPAGKTFVYVNESFTPPSGAYYMRFAMQTVYGTTYKNDISVNYPATVTTYNAYKGKPISVSWQDEAGTVYDGYIDVVSGELVATHLNIDMGTLSYSYDSTNAFFSVTPSGIKTPLTSIAEVICSTYKVNAGISDSAMATADTGIYLVLSNGKHKIKDTRYTTASAIQTALTGQSLCYPLATPQTYQLTPQQILTLIGNNTVFVDTGSVSVTYQASIKGYIDKVLAS